MRETLFNTLDQNINNYNDYICPSFELIVLKKRFINLKA